VSLSTQLQTVLVTLGIVVALASAIGVSIKVATAEVSRPIGRKSRVAGVVLGVLVAAFAFWNPFAHSFSVWKARIDVAPARYQGKCPMSVNLTGIVRASSGSGHVTSDLFLSSEEVGTRGLSPGGHDIFKATMENGDSETRRVVIQRSGRDMAHFIVLAPEEQGAAYPVTVRCTKAQ
jgi:hypothetical protein